MLGSVFSLDYENRRIIGLLPLGSCHLPWPIPQELPAPSSEVWPLQPPLHLSRGGEWSAQVVHAMDGLWWVQTGSAGRSSLREGEELICISSLELPQCPQGLDPAWLICPSHSVIKSLPLSIKTAQPPLPPDMSWLVSERNGLGHHCSLPRSEEMHTGKTGSSPQPQRPGAHLSSSCGLYPAFSLGL